ncbi:glycosyltransferase, partial [Acidihalobacter prosperus]
MLSVIVPTYNERDNAAELIRRTLLAFEQIPEAAELLIIDDDSPDGTSSIMKAEAESQNA